MKKMFLLHIPTHHASVSLFTFATLGISESKIEQLLHPILPPDVTIGYQASRRGNTIKVLFSKDNINHHFLEQLSKNSMNISMDTMRQISQRLLALSSWNRNKPWLLPRVVLPGKIASWLTSISGASRYFMEGAVVYSNQSKQRLCSVQPKLLEKHGAVSKEVAIAMAQGIRRNAGTDWGISVTGIAGPTGGTKEKPVGTVHIACASAHNTMHRQFYFHGVRDQVTESSTSFALFMLYQQLSKF